ncbi:EIICB-Glc [Mesomycoplasma dispar]|uniref:EIICB-Glc n=1 Tax=Mesomycoplasma dispar TaxID=86660 RepID=A0AAJ5NQW7_9BACT|nr:PTS transporter subunit EIIC [Mesomycoplasma dispar]AJR12336.1 PTS sugar transporter subunit IIA [Mesomycoplasma dispar]VEU62164.1 EIICB-Glc [Mesomycoplasma dispar]
MSSKFSKKIKTFTPKGKTSTSENSVFNRILNQLQRLGKSLMFPIAVLPIAALLLRIGALIQDPAANNSIGISEVQKFIGRLISTPGGIVFDNLAIIFAIGISFGFAKDNRGEAALVGAVVWYGMTALLKQNQLAEAIYSKVLVAQSGELKGLTQLLYFLKSGKPVYQLDSGVIGGITVGIIVAFLYNKYKNVKLPQTLSFFGGRRFVPMLGILSIIPLGLFFAIIWPWAQYALIKIGSALSDQSANRYARGFYVSIYAFLNRLLQPFGLHHILNTFVWFQLPIEGKLISPVVDQVGKTIAKVGDIYTVNGDITAFNTGIIGSGGFTTGFFPLYLGGLPGAAVAMIFAAKRENRKTITTFLAGATLVSFLTGIDEPLIFTFIFISPLLWLLNAFLTSLIYMFVTWTGMSIGIGFSAGFIDYIVSFPRSWAFAKNSGIMANPLWIWAFSAIMFLIQGSSFYFCIKKFDIKTLGREDKIETEINNKKENLDIENTDKLQLKNKIVTQNKEKFNDDYEKMAITFIEILGKENIEEVSNCATRLRLIVKDNKKNDELDAKILAAGGRGIVRVGNKGLQIIIGTDVEFVADHLRKMIGK